MKRWYSLTCPICGFRFPLQKFRPAMKPILYPVQVVTGGGRARGFRVEKYLPWTTLPALKQTNAWNSLLYLYGRLADAYDHFYQVLGFLSPEMCRILQEFQKPYSDAYRTNPSPEYSQAFASKDSPHDIVEPYGDADYPEAYAHLLINPASGGICDE
ncbi:MAG: hypothetical protein ABSB28_07030 [Candidatus Bathyarchaeia archaeon]